MLKIGAADEPELVDSLRAAVLTSLRQSEERRVRNATRTRTRASNQASAPQTTTQAQAVQQASNSVPQEAASSVGESRGSNLSPVQNSEPIIGTPVNVVSNELHGRQAGRSLHQRNSAPRNEPGVSLQTQTLRSEPDSETGLLLAYDGLGTQSRVSSGNIPPPQPTTTQNQHIGARSQISSQQQLFSLGYQTFQAPVVSQGVRGNTQSQSSILLAAPETLMDNDTPRRTELNLSNHSERVSPNSSAVQSQVEGPGDIRTTSLYQPRNVNEIVNSIRNVEERNIPLAARTTSRAIGFNTKYLHTDMEATRVMQHNLRLQQSTMQDPRVLDVMGNNLYARRGLILEQPEVNSQGRERGAWRPHIAEGLRPNQSLMIPQVPGLLLRSHDSPAINSTDNNVVTSGVSARQTQLDSVRGGRTDSTDALFASRSRRFADVDHAGDECLRKRARWILPNPNHDR